MTFSFTMQICCCKRISQDIKKCMGHVVGTGKISRSVDQSVVRKLWVVIWVVDDCSGMNRHLSCTIQVKDMMSGGGEHSELWLFSNTRSVECLVHVTLVRAARGQRSQVFSM